MNRIAVVAAGLALLAPATLIASCSAGGDTGPDPVPAPATAPASATESATPTPSPSDREVVVSRTFDVRGLPTGAPPSIEWSDGHDVHRADGSVAPGVLPDIAVQFAPMGSGWMVATFLPNGHRDVRWTSSTGEPGEGYPNTSGFVTSPEGEVVAWVDGDGVVRVVQRDGDEAFQMAGPIRAPGQFPQAAVVTSEDCVERLTTMSGCTVYVNTVSRAADGPAVWYTTSHGIVTRFTAPVLTLTAAHEGVYAGITAYHDDHSTCSARFDRDGQIEWDIRWETCHNRLVGFSPSGAHLIGAGSGVHGADEGWTPGTSHVSLLDASDGTVLVDLTTNTTAHSPGAVQLEWEDDAHVLMVVHADDAWSIVRLGLDGTMEYAVPPR